MESYIFVPRNLRDAALHLRHALHGDLNSLSKKRFIRAWSAITYLFPGLHPEGYADWESGWPRVLRPFAEEAWRRADAGELDDNELYTSDAQWAGLYDRMFRHEPDEVERRLELAAEYGEPLRD